LARKSRLSIENQEHLTEERAKGYLTDLQIVPAQYEPKLARDIGMLISSAAYEEAEHFQPRRFPLNSQGDPVQCLGRLSKRPTDAIPNDLEPPGSIGASAKLCNRVNSI
jgi:hypothetical protein